MIVRSAHSMLHPDDLCEAVKDRFGFHGPLSCRLQRSFINDVYRLDGHGHSWFLRISPAGWRSLVEVEAELSFVQALDAMGAPVIEPVALAGSTERACIVEAPEGPRVAALFKAAEGVEPIFGNEPDALAFARRYGKVCAALHASADKLPPIRHRPAMDADVMLHEPLATIMEHVSGPEDRQFLTGIGDRLGAAIAWTGLTNGFAHGDLNSSNILFRHDGETIIDFDCCGWGYRANDIAAFARGVTLARLPGPDASNLISAYLSGYSEITQIQEIDRDALPAFLIVQRLWVASLHFERRDRFGLTSFGPAYAARLMVWLKAWASILDVAPDWLSASSDKAAALPVD